MIMEKPLLGRGVQSTKKHWSRALLCFLAPITIITFTVLFVVYHEKTVGCSSVESDKAVVATDDSRCSEIGLSMLRQGGHAVDAAVAAALCLGVVNPSESGIGGGGFMLVRSSSTSQTQAFSMFSTAPLASTEDMFENNPEAKRSGPLSIAVPGELVGLHRVHSQYGRLPWKTLFQPAIKLAIDGFVVAPYLGSVITLNERKIRDDPGLELLFTRKGRLLQTGETCFNKQLGRTLEEVAEIGPQALYDNIIGKKLVEDVQAAGGILTMEDLRNFRVDVPDAVTVNAMGYTIVGMPPPSTGTVGLALVANIFDSYRDPDAAKGSLGLHRMIEALKHMFGIRMYLGDPKFVNISTVISDMLSPSYAEVIKQKISDYTTFPPEHYMYRWSQLKDHGTSHLCVVDEDRNAVSLTTTLADYFGSGNLSMSTGIILNNQMSSFSTPTEISDDTLPPAPNNFIQPNKRPSSSMTPIIILKDGQLTGVTGGSGGLNIIPGVLQVFLNHFILGMEPLAAVQSPRVYHRLIPNVVLYENWTLLNGDHIELPNDKKNFLRQRAHVLQATDWGATCQLVVQNLENHAVNMSRKLGKDSKQIFRGKLTAISDPRKDGKPAGL